LIDSGIRSPQAVVVVVVSAGEVVAVVEVDVVAVSEPDVVDVLTVGSTVEEVHAASSSVTKKASGAALLISRSYVRSFGR